MKKLLTCIVSLLLFTGAFSQIDSAKCVYSPLVLMLDSSCYDYDYTFLDPEVPTELSNYGYTLDGNLYESFLFYPNRRYAQVYEVQDNVVNGVRCCAVWTTVNRGSTALLANYVMGEFLTVCVYEYYYFEWVEDK